MFCFWLLGVVSRDFSQDEKERTAHCEYKAQKFRAKLTKLVRTCGDFCVI